MLKRGFNKRGAGHIEMIMSFILFLVFISFLLIVVRPYETNVLSGAVVSSLHNSFREQAYTNLSEIFLRTKASVASDCFLVQFPDNLFKFAIVSGTSLVKDVKNGDSLKESDLSSRVSLGIKGGISSYKVYISPEFDDSTLSNCVLLDYGTYVFGSILEERIISNETLWEMKQMYDNDYDNLKIKLNFPAGLDFAIVSDTVTMKKVIPDKVEVNSRDYLERVLFKDGSVINERFTMMVW